VTDWLEGEIDRIAAGLRGAPLFQLMVRIRQDSVVRARFRSEVQLRSRVAAASTPLILDGFIVDDFYCGRLDGLIALQVAAALLQDEINWSVFSSIHDVETFAHDYSEDENDDDLMAEDRQEYGEMVSLAEISSSPSTRQLLAVQPGAESAHILRDEPETYLSSGDSVQGFEKVVYRSGSNQIALIWLPYKKNLRLSLTPPQCEEKIFMGASILLQREKKSRSPDRRDYSNIVANALFLNVEEPWGNRLSVSRAIVPQL